MYQGRIGGVGPRYCPSIEDKINRFADRDRHQIFVEPEGFNTVEIYVNGFSTSLPEEVQHEALRMIPGFENCRIFRPGYAIEYDYFPPTQLQYSLETKMLPNLFFAGQINGTTGYEEAACQGLMAGINAHQKAKHLEPFVLKRSEAYIGVLIDDLISKGTDEPYRMFTSRAEFRTLLRQDNADIRLTERSHKLGLASTERLQAVNLKNESVAEIKNTLNNFNIDADAINPFLESIGSSVISEKQRASKIILRPNVALNDLMQAVPNLKEAFGDASVDSIEQAEIQIKYERYIEKEVELVQKMSQLENLIIPENFDYDRVSAVSKEALQKFKKIKPRTLGQASRISGVNPSDVQILMVYMGR
jgi:tRNA uridine 5-carboxymethylaminomethyl modification enzyme